MVLKFFFLFFQTYTMFACHHCDQTANFASIVTHQIDSHPSHNIHFEEQYPCEKTGLCGKKSYIWPFTPFDVIPCFTLQPNSTDRTISLHLIPPEEQLELNLHPEFQTENLPPHEKVIEIDAEKDHPESLLKKLQRIDMPS